MIDTHTHIYFRENFENEFSEIISRGLAEGVSHFVLPNVDESTIEEVRYLHRLFPDITSMAIGLHPTEVEETWNVSMKTIEKELSSGEYKAIGEVGLDLYWDKSKALMQNEAFEWQLRLAEEAILPVIIHSREALAETLEVIKKVSPTIPLIFHSFTGDISAVRKIREVCDPFFGINGVVTYKNAEGLREALNEITLYRMILETDSPYLTPMPHRGKRNESSYLRFVRDKIAETMDISPHIVEEKTDLNACSIFQI